MKSKGDEDKEKIEEIEELLKPRLPTKIVKEVKVLESKGGNGLQYSLKLPIAFVEELNIKKGDIFVIECDPETKEYSIRLKKNVKNN
ncbi:hypothetical protein HYW74_02040 [Candidatus Pacearchaeota archaeon]|nr:hypothetical protein [Candidatus Pacearchaeota archaeon]